MKATCAHCKKKFEMKAGHYNRAMKMGLNVYCSRKHSGLGRRRNVSKEQLKEEKAWYDLFIRASMTEEEKELDRLQNALYFQMDYSANPEKYRKERRRRQAAHNEYCRQPEYKKYKKGYDQQYRAKKNYGPYAESFLVLRELELAIDNRSAREQNNIHNKTQKRKRQWQKAKPKLPISSLLRP